MNLARLASRVAVGGVTAALATAGLVGVTSTSASAAPVTTSYTCSALGNNFTVPVMVDIALLPPTAPAGFPVPAGLLSFKSSITVDPTLQGALDLLGATGGKSDDFGTAFGNEVAPATVKWDTKTPGATPADPTVYSGKGANAAFTLPAAGTYAVKMPAKFTLIATKADGSTAASATCTSSAPKSLGSITLSKQASVTKAKAPKSAKVGKVVAVKVKVTNDYVKTGGPAATGKVIVKDGKKTVGKGKLKKGKVTVKVKGLKAGKHKLTVTYKGDSFTDKSKSKALKLTVKK